MSKRLTTARRVAELLPALDAAFPTDLLPSYAAFWRPRRARPP
jgi:hypothetical protein